MNSGSIDAGRDPNWNRDGTYNKRGQKRTWESDHSMITTTGGDDNAKTS
jgi:hypothetical protein